VVPNRLAEALVRARLIPGLKRFRELRREVRYGERSRIDLMLTSGTTEHLVEVKNCHLVYPDRCAYFPDSVSERAAGHLRELAREVQRGRKATVLFVLQRPDGLRLRPSRLHDPAFAEAAAEAAAAGVSFRAARVHTQPHGFEFTGLIPVDLGDYDAAALEGFRAELEPASGWKRRGRKKGAPG
jgi:sugar fermentation stimulation protein A